MESKEELRLVRSLSTKDLIIYGIIFMIPVAPVAFYGSFLTPAHGMVALAYLVGMIAMLFTGFSYATMAQHYPYAGSVYTYVQRGTNPSLGFLGGWGITLDYILIPTITYLISASFGHELLPLIPTWAWIVGIVIFNTIVNLAGVNIVAKFSWVLFGLQILVLGIYLVGVVRLLVLGQIHPNVVAVYNPTQFNFNGVLQATGIVIVSYLGFDAISTLAEEANDPRHSVGRAIVGAILGIGSLFVITTLLAGWVWPNYQALNPNTAFSSILNAVGGPNLVRITDIVVVLSFGLAGGQEGQTAISRILYAMGRDGILPRQLSFLHPKYRTPWVAIIFVGLASLVLSLILNQDTVSNLVSFGALFGFLLLNLAVIWRFFIKNPNKGLNNVVRYLISPLIGFGVSLWIFLNLALSAKLVGLGWLLVGIAILLYQTAFFTKPVPHLNFS